MAKGDDGMLSNVDRRVLLELQRDGSISNAALGDAVHVSESAAARHRRGLKRDGYIERYAAIVNIRRLGYHEVTFAEVGLATQSEEAQAAFLSAVVDVEEVIACYAIAGDVDYLLHVITRDSDHYDEVSHRVTRMPGVVHLRSLLVLRTEVQRETIGPA